MVCVWHRAAEETPRAHSDNTADMAGKAADLHIKLMLIGDSGVGKTSMMVRFADRTFDTNNTPTIGIDYKIRHYELDGRRVKLQIMDTAGQERFRSIAQAHYRNADGVIVVYDTTSQESFDHVKEWVGHVKKNIEDGQVAFSLVGNKSDLKDKRKVAQAKGKALGEEIGMPFFENTCTQEKTVEAVFYDLAKRCVERAQARAERNGSMQTVNLEQGQGKKKGGCC